MDDSKTPLIDKIYKLLTSSSERAAYYGNIEPKFQIYVSHQQLDQIRKEAINHYVFNIEASTNKSFLFGHQIIVVDDIPYVRLVE